MTLTPVPQVVVASRSSSGNRLLFAAGGVLVALACLGYGVLTEQVWDDFWVQFRYAQNLVHGQGLTYNPGQKIQGFDSVLGVLVPAAAEAIMPDKGIEPALWSWRVINILGLAGGVVLLMRYSSRRIDTDPFAALVVAALIAFDAKTIAYTSNGHGAGLTFLWLAMGLTAVCDGLGRRWVWLALAGAGLLYTRSDGFLWWGALATAAAFGDPARRSQTLGAILKAAAVALVLFLPWLVFAWVYYGNPLPQSWFAAAGAYVDESSGTGWLGRLGPALLRQPAALFEPVFASMGGWPAWVRVFGYGATALALISGLMPAADRLSRTAAFALIFSLIGLGVAEARNGLVHPGTYPPATAFAIVALAMGLAGVIHRFQMPRPRLWLRTAQAAVAICMLALSATSWVQAAVFQKEVTNKVRRGVGIWLKDHAKPEQTVFAETPGTIGYYSGSSMADWPGNLSPQVVAARSGRSSLLTAVADLQPDWIVLRTPQLKQAELIPALRDNYTLRYTSSAAFELNLYDQLPGGGYVAGHATYVIFEHTPGAAPPIAATEHPATPPQSTEPTPPSQPQ